MMTALRNLAAIRRNQDGTFVIETAIVLPVLIMLCLGGFEISRLVSRNNELQIAIAEAGAIALASLPENQADINRIEAILETSTGLDATNVVIVKKYRCNSDSSLVTDLTSCATGAVISEFLEITISDWYTPIWTEYGISGQMDYDLTRRVQIS